MDNLGKWMAGGIVGFVGIVGLFIAAHAEEVAAYWFGMALALLAIVVVFVLIKRSFDEVDAQRARGETDTGRH